MKRKEIIELVNETLNAYKTINKKTKEEKGYIIALKHFKELLKL